jgi:hypothetical protein
VRPRRTAWMNPQRPLHVCHKGSPTRQSIPCLRRGHGGRRRPGRLPSLRAAHAPLMCLEKLTHARPRGGVRAPSRVRPAKTIQFARERPRAWRVEDLCSSRAWGRGDGRQEASCAAARPSPGAPFLAELCSHSCCFPCLRTRCVATIKCPKDPFSTQDPTIQDL